MSNAEYVDFQALLTETADSLKPIILKLRDVIFELDKDVCEVVRLKERSATYGVGPKKMSQGYVYLMPHKAWINLGFLRGSSLNDPEEILEGTGKNMRHIKVKSLEEIESLPLVQLIQLAKEERLNV